MAKKQEQNDTFDPSDFLGDDEIETAGEGADFGDSLDTVGSGDDDPEQYGDQGVDTLGGDQEDDDAASQDDSGEEPAEGDEPEADDEEAVEQDDPEQGEQDDPEKGDADKAASEPDTEGQRKRHMIPKRRLDSEVAKRRKLQQQLEEMQKQQKQVQEQLQEKQKVPEEDIQKWLQESADKALNGETEESAKLQQKAFDAMAQNRGTGQQSGQQEAIDPNEVIQQVEERVEMKSKVKEVFEAYPSLDPNNDSFDEDLNEEVLELNDFYVNKGYTPASAVEKAVNVLAAQHELTPANAQPTPAPKKPARDTKPKVEKKMETARRQPPEPTNRRGNKASSEDTVDINNLSDDELMALPENVRARLRGD